MAHIDSEFGQLGEDAMANELASLLQFPGVMISSTFLDFEPLRRILIRTVSNQHLHPIAMEQIPALADADVIDSSLQMVHEAAAYIGVIGVRYGQIPASQEMNPDGISLTEMEFRETQRPHRPTLIFSHGEGYPIARGEDERDPVRIENLKASRQSPHLADAGQKEH